MNEVYIVLAMKFCIIYINFYITFHKKNDQILNMLQLLCIFLFLANYEPQDWANSSKKTNQILGKCGHCKMSGHARMCKKVALPELAR